MIWYLQRRKLLTGWPCQYCSFNSYWQGHPVNSAFRTTADRVTLSITVETAEVLTGSRCQYCINKHCWQSHPVNSDHLCIIDRVALSTVHQNMLLTGWITTNEELKMRSIRACLTSVSPYQQESDYFHPPRIVINLLLPVIYEFDSWT